VNIDCHCAHPSHCCRGQSFHLKQTGSFAGSTLAVYYLYYYLDDLPLSVRRHLDALVVTDLTHPKPLSKLLAYVIDGYFSTKPYSKTLALLILTIIIVVNGSLAIFVVTGDSLYAAFWQVTPQARNQ
jgi:hypothetical protein